MSLVPVDASSPLAITDYLTRARDWLATCVEMTGPEQIAGAKAEIATAAEAAKQLGLSKEIQLDALEMVRRAEYALAKAIRKGQEEGTIATQGMRTDKLLANSEKLPAARDIDPTIYDNGSQILTMSDGVAPESFEQAIEEAKAEGNLSRANVVRKIKGCSKPTPLTERLDEIRELASQGADRSQLAKHFGVGEQHIADICQRNGIVTATEILGRRQRRNPNRVLENVTEAVEVAAMSLRDIDPASLDEEEALERLDSLTTSINALSKAVKKIKESFRD